MPAETKNTNTPNSDIAKVATKISLRLFTDFLLLPNVKLNRRL
mgnify:CR=1 FL=1